MNTKTVGLILGLTAGVSWGVMDIASQYLLHTSDFSPAGFMSVTLLVTSIVLLLLELERNGFKKLVAPLTQKRNFFDILLYGLFTLGTEGAFFTCVKLSNASVGAILATTLPFFIMAIACVVDRKLPTWIEVFAAFLAMAGVTLLVTGGNVGHLTISASAAIFGLLSPFFSACYTIQTRRLVQAIGPGLSTAWGMTFAAIGVNIYMPFWETHGKWTFMTVLCVLIVAVIGHTVASICYLGSAGKIKPSLTGLMETVEPLTAVILGVTLLGTVLDWPMAVGGVLVLAAVVIASLRARRGGNSEEKVSGNGK